MNEKLGTLQAGSDILVQCLVNHGVDTVFAYPGGASMPLHQSLTRFAPSIRTILPRHEQGGGFMAGKFPGMPDGARLEEGCADASSLSRQRAVLARYAGSV